MRALAPESVGLNGVDLKIVDLKTVDLESVDLKGVNLKGVDLKSWVKRFSLLVLGGALMLLAGCESKDTKQSARPVQQALAPSIEVTGTATGHSSPAAANQQPTPAPAQ